MNNQQIQIFLTLARCRNFTAAGEQLFLSQSVISYHIRAMEKELGFNLFIRNTHSVSLTPAGEALYKSLSEVNLHFLEAVENARHIAKQEDNLLRICFANPTPPTMMGRIINSLYQIPGIDRLEFINRSYNDVLQPLLQGEADILFSYPRFFREEPNLRMKKFCQVWPACMVAPDHPLAGKPTLELSDLAGQKLLFPDSENIRTNFEEIYNRICSSPAQMPEIDNAPQSFEQMQGLTAAGRGIMLVYSTENRRQENIDGLVSIPLSEFPSDYLIMIWRENRLNSSGQALIRETVEP